MAITLFCPHLKCRCILQVPDNTRGKRVRCGQCGTTFLVPDRPPPAKAAKAAAETEDEAKAKSKSKK